MSLESWVEYDQTGRKTVVNPEKLIYKSTGCHFGCRRGLSVGLLFLQRLRRSRSSQASEKVIPPSFHALLVKFFSEFLYTYVEDLKFEILQWLKSNFPEFLK